MGTKGDRLSQDATLSAELLVEKLHPIGDVSSKKMFGGFGIFHRGKMFGIVDSKGQVFLKANDAIKHHFEEINAPKHSRMPYYAIPKKVLDIPEELIIWASRSIEILN